MRSAIAKFKINIFNGWHALAHNIVDIDMILNKRPNINIKSKMIVNIMMYVFDVNIVGEKLVELLNIIFLKSKNII